MGCSIGKKLYIWEEGFVGEGIEALPGTGRLFSRKICRCYSSCVWHAMAMSWDWSQMNIAIAGGTKNLNVLGTSCGCTYPIRVVVFQFVSDPYAPLKAADVARYTIRMPKGRTKGGNRLQVEELSDEELISFKELLISNEIYTVALV